MNLQGSAEITPSEGSCERSKDGKGPVLYLLSLPPSPGQNSHFLALWEDRFSHRLELAREENLAIKLRRTCRHLCGGEEIEEMKG